VSLKTEIQILQNQLKTFSEKNLSRETNSKQINANIINTKLIEQYENNSPKKICRMSEQASTENLKTQLCKTIESRNMPRENIAIEETRNEEK